MARYTLVYDEKTREFVPKEEFYAKRVSDSSAYVIGDISPYKSMVDGSIIGGRRQHREHLSEHRLVEVGNETAHLKPKGELQSPPGLKETLARNVYNKLRY